MVLQYCKRTEVFVYVRGIAISDFESRSRCIATPWRPHGDPIATPRSVQYCDSVQYDPGLLHAPLGYDPPIALTLIGRIHHEIKPNDC